MDAGYVVRYFYVTCRIGSLESCLSTSSSCSNVTCRIGSLEINSYCFIHIEYVTCRRGSLEIERVDEIIHTERYLPHRQLRKKTNLRQALKVSYLPHRQLRKYD